MFRILGIYYVMVFVDDVQKNVDFYVGVLVLRLVKKIINFDVLDVYYLYYGNEDGVLGIIIIFFLY